MTVKISVLILFIYLPFHNYKINQQINRKLQQTSYIKANPSQDRMKSPLQGNMF